MNDIEAVVAEFERLTASAAARAASDESLKQDIATVKTELACLLAGRVAETLRFGDAGMGSGARQDFETATALTRKAIMEWGMDAELGMVHLASLGANLPLSESLRANIERRVVHWLDLAQSQAQEVLTMRAAQHLTLCQALRTRKRLSGTEVACLLGPKMDLLEQCQPTS